MKYLLDTHAFIWWGSQPDNLSSKVLGICESEANELFLSLASIWEMQIKQQLGKLELRLSLQEMVEDQMQNNGIQLLNIEPKHIFGLSVLDNHHRDPFDRLIIVQSMQENMPVLSRDGVFEKYPVQVLW